MINSDMGGSEASEAEAPGGGSMLCHGEGQFVLCIAEKQKFMITDINGKVEQGVHASEVMCACARAASKICVDYQMCGCVLFVSNMLL